MGKGQRLTVIEERIMKVLWSLECGAVKDIINGYNNPKPKYTTMATQLDILVRKGVIKRQKIGNVYEYSPRLEEKSYVEGLLDDIVVNYYANSYLDLISSQIYRFLSDEEVKLLFEQVKSQRKIN